MQPEFLEKRVEILERTVDGLSELPARVGAVEGQILQLRTEMRDEFSATRSEASQSITEVRADVTALKQDLRAEMKILHEDALMRIGLVADVVEDTRQQVRVVQGDLTAFRGEMSAFQLRTEASQSRTEAFQSRMEAFRSQMEEFRSQMEEFQREVTSQLAVISARLTRRRRKSR